MFTIFKNLEEFNELIQKSYHLESNSLQKIKYQFENNYNIDELKVLVKKKRYNPDHNVKIINKYIQRFCLLTKQDRIGKYIKKRKLLFFIYRYIRRTYYSYLI